MSQETALLCLCSSVAVKKILCLQVSINGALTWGSAPGESAVTPMQDVKLIAPYFGDVDATYGGNVFYRSTNDSALLERVSAIITANFDGLSEGLPLSSLFIATWHRIPANGGPVDKVRL